MRLCSTAAMFVANPFKVQTASAGARLALGGTKIMAILRRHQARLRISNFALKMGVDNSEANV